MSNVWLVLDFMLDLPLPHFLPHQPHFNLPNRFRPMCNRHPCMRETWRISVPVVIIITTIIRIIIWTMHSKVILHHSSNNHNSNNNNNIFSPIMPNKIIFRICNHINNHIHFPSNSNNSSSNSSSSKCNLIWWCNQPIIL